MPTCWLIPYEKPARYDAVYRYISVNRGERIVLGKPFSLPDLATRVNDTTLVLHPDAVPDPDSIEIHVAQGDTVYAMDFVYRANETFGSLMATYVKSLGPPTRAGNRDAVWQDSLTHFRIEWTGGDTIGSLRSRITDRRRGVADGS